MKQHLTTEIVAQEAFAFSETESIYDEPSLYGVTDGKAIGTYLEHKFRKMLCEKYFFELGNSASGIDFPDINLDVKVTRNSQPQSSCPFKSARQKIYGLGYSLLIFVYEKYDDHNNRTARLNMSDTIFVDKNYTADFQITSGIINIINNQGNEDDIIGFMMEKNLPVDDIEALNIALEVLKNPPNIGYLTISNALQWRLQYRRVINIAGTVEGVLRIR